ncbi:MAG: dehydrogenase, partial [Nonomuraea sp.]|nr:dehydrogenase [Nonomuraea sp.]
GGDGLCSVAESLAALYVAEAADLSLRERRPVQVAEVVLA